MRRHLKSFPDGTMLCFSKGKLDEWLVSFFGKGGRRILSPEDTWHLKELLDMGDNERAMEQVYFLGRQMPLGGGGGQIAFKDLEIPKGNNIRESKAWSFLGAAMISEEEKRVGPNKDQPSRCGALLKIIGCYQALMLEWEVSRAAKWSVDRSASEIKAWARSQGILEKLSPPEPISQPKLF